MTKRTVKISLLILFAFTARLFAQQKAANNKKQPEQPKSVAAGPKKSLTVPVYLGNSDQHGGAVRKETFNNLLRQGLTSHDSSNNKYKVVGFDLGYADRGLFEDSVGNIIPVTDFTSVHCSGERIPSYMETSGQVTKSGEVSMSLYDRVKAGDTLYFDHIRLVKYLSATETDSVTQIGKSMKFYIVR